MKTLFVSSFLLLAAAALAQGPQTPVVAGPVTLGSPCIPGSPFYANLANGQMASCQLVSGQYVWALLAAGSAPTPPAATNSTLGTVQLPPQGTTPILGFQTSGVESFAHHNALTLGAKGDGSTDDTATLNAAISTTCAVNCSLSLPNTGQCYQISSPLVIGNGSQFINFDLNGQLVQFGANGPFPGTCIQQNNPGQDIIDINVKTSSGHSISLRGLILKYAGAAPSGTASVTTNQVTAVTGSFGTSWYQVGGNASIYIAGSAQWSTPCPSDVCTITGVASTSLLTVSGSCTSGCPSAAAWTVGVAINSLNTTTQTSGFSMSYMSVAFAGLGLSSASGYQSPVIEKSTFYGCYIGWNAGAFIGAPNLQTVYFQGGTIGLNIPFMAGAIFQTPLFNSVVFESQSGPEVQIAGNWLGGVLTAVWHEFPSSDMYRIIGPGSLHGVTWVAPQFDGSSGSGGRNVFNIVAAATSAVKAYELTFVGGFAANLNGGYFMYTANDPSGSSDPAFLNIQTLGTDLGGFLIKGLDTSFSNTNQTNLFQGYTMKASQIVTNSVYSVQPPCEIHSYNTVTYCQGSTGIPTQWSRFTVSYATGTGLFTVTPPGGGTATTVAAAAATSQFLSLFSGPAYSAAAASGFSVEGLYIKPLVACTSSATTLNITGFGNTFANTLFASTSTGTPVLNLSLTAAVSLTNFYLSSLLASNNTNSNAFVVGILLASTGGNISGLTNNCSWTVDVKWGILP